MVSADLEEPVSGQKALAVKFSPPDEFTLLPRQNFSKLKTGS